MLLNRKKEEGKYFKRISWRDKKRPDEEWVFIPFFNVPSESFILYMKLPEQPFERLWEIFTTFDAFDDVIGALAAMDDKHYLKLKKNIELLKQKEVKTKKEKNY